MMSWTVSKVALDDAKATIMRVVGQQNTISPEELLTLVTNQPNVSMSDARRAMRVLVERGNLRLDREFHIRAAEPDRDMVEAG